MSTQVNSKEISLVRHWHSQMGVCFSVTTPNYTMTLPKPKFNAFTAMLVGWAIDTHYQKEFNFRIPNSTSVAVFTRDEVKHIIKCLAKMTTGV